jgi:hypothetical protein
MAPPDVSDLTPLPNPRRVVTANNPSSGKGEVLFDDTPEMVVGAEPRFMIAVSWTLILCVDWSQRHPSRDWAVDYISEPCQQHVKVRRLSYL